MRVPAAPPEDASLQTWTAYLLQVQAAACRMLGSDLYARLLSAVAEDVRAGGAAWTVLQPHATREQSDALALRFMAAVHRLVLTGQVPALAAYYPSAGGDRSGAGAGDALQFALRDHAATLTRDVALPCQTNEVGRCAALVGGFLTVAANTGLPLRLLEVGASAGLNLRWDRYSYADTSGAPAWGDPASLVQLRGHWEIDPALLATRVRVAQRRGCDPRPIEVTSAEGQLALTSSVWADQPARFERLRGALEIAQREPAAVEQARASDWLPARLAEDAAGTATVVYHSVVEQYMSAAERREMRAALSAAGARATPDAPLYWLRMEPEHLLRAMTVRLTCWPAGDEQLLATAGAHGDPVRWHANGA